MPTKSILKAANVPIIGGHHVLALQSSPQRAHVQVEAFLAIFREDHLLERTRATIVLDEDLRIAAIQRAGQREDFDVLSGGTKEQLAVLTRLAFAKLLLGQGRPATVIRP